MAKSDELVIYITRKVATYLDTPREERKKNQEMIRLGKEHWSYWWFGLVPFSTKMMVKQIAVRRKRSSDHMKKDTLIE